MEPVADFEAGNAVVRCEIKGDIYPVFPGKASTELIIMFRRYLIALLIIPGL